MLRDEMQKRIDTINAEIEKSMSFIQQAQANHNGLIGALAEAKYIMEQIISKVEAEKSV